MRPCLFERNRQNYNVDTVNHVNVAENQQNQDVELENCEYKIYPDAGKHPGATPGD